MPTPITTAATTTTIKTINGFGRLFTRAFHATPVACTKHSKKRLAEMLKDLPQYPYPINRTFKQSWFGLYGGKHIQFGNNVPESRNKTRRSWLPNVREKKLYSECLGKFISVRMVASVLRTVDKVGGLDNYLTGTKPARIKELGPMGWKLRWEVMRSPKYLERRAAELKAMGLSAEGAEESVAQQLQAEAGSVRSEEPAAVEQKQEKEEKKGEKEEEEEEEKEKREKKEKEEKGEKKEEKKEEKSEKKKKKEKQEKKGKEKQEKQEKQELPPPQQQQKHAPQLEVDAAGKTSL